MFLEIGSLIITHLVIPVTFLIWLWRGKDLSKLDWLAKLLVVALYSVHIFLSGRWDWFSYYLIPICNPSGNPQSCGINPNRGTS